MSDAPTPHPEKKVDSDWLRRVEEEKTTRPSPKPESPGTDAGKRGPASEVNFTLFLSTLGLQAYVALGELEDPISRSKKVNLDQARYMIDMIKLIQEKTRGNLTPAEDKTVEQLLYDLQMKYVEKSPKS